MKFRPQLLSAALVAVTAAGVIVFVTAAVQQNYRQTANDPQIQLADDASSSLSQGIPPLSIVAGPKVAMSSSLAPFTMIFDSSHNLIATNATVTGGHVPIPPAGTFDYAKQHGQDRFTWQTANGDRYAAIFNYASGPHHEYVLAARSLREVEKREDSLRLMALATLACVAVIWFAWIAIIRLG